MALPTVRDSTSGATRNVSSMVVTLPTKQSGDLLVIFAASDKEVQALSGWSLMRDSQLDAYGRDYAYFYKISDGTEANPTLVSSTSNFSGLAWVALSLTGGISLSSLPGGAVDVNYDAETYVAQQDNINCLYDNALLVQFVMSHNNNVGTTLTTANGWTELEDVVEPVDGIIGIWAGSKTVTAAGAQTAPVVTVSGGTNVTDLLTFHFIDNNEVPVKQAFTGGDPQTTNTVSGPIFLRCINPKYDWLFIFGANAISTNWNTGFLSSAFGTTVFYTLGIGASQEDLAVKYGKMTADTSVYSIGTSAFYSKSAFILRGGHETDPIARAGYSWERQSTTTPAVPALKTTHANQLHLVFCGCDYGTSAASMAASGYTTLYRGGDGTNNGIAFAAYKEYTTAGSETSCSITNAYNHQHLVHSLLITPRAALKSDLPAFVRAVIPTSYGVTGGLTLYNSQAKDDDILLLFAGCKDTTAAIDFTLTTPSLTLTELESEYDATHGWNIKLKMAQLTADTSGDLVMNFSTNYSTSSIYAVFVERAIPESAERRVESKSTTTTTTLTASLDLPDSSVGVAFAYVPAVLSDVDGDFCNQCAHYELAGNAISTSLIIDGSPDPGDGSHVFTADVTGKMYVAFVSLARSIGGAGLFFGQDF